MSLRLDIATIAKIEADRIYDLILPQMADHETVSVPLPFFENVVRTGRQLEDLAPGYVKRALDGLEAAAKVHRLRRRVVVPTQTLANVAAAFRIASESAQGGRP